MLEYLIFFSIFLGLFDDIHTIPVRQTSDWVQHSLEQSTRASASNVYGLSGSVIYPQPGVNPIGFFDPELGLGPTPETNNPQDESPFVTPRADLNERQDSDQPKQIIIFETSKTKVTTMANIKTYDLSVRKWWLPIPSMKLSCYTSLLVITPYLLYTNFWFTWDSLILFFNERPSYNPGSYIPSPNPDNGAGLFDEPEFELEYIRDDTEINLGEGSTRSGNMGDVPRSLNPPMDFEIPSLDDKLSFPPLIKVSKDNLESSVSGLSSGFSEGSPSLDDYRLIYSKSYPGDEPNTLKSIRRDPYIEHDQNKLSHSSEIVFNQGRYFIYRDTFTGLLHGIYDSFEFLDKSFPTFMSDPINFEFGEQIWMLQIRYHHILKPIRDIQHEADISGTSPDIPVSDSVNFNKTIIEEISNQSGEIEPESIIGENPIPDIEYRESEDSIIQIEPIGDEDSNLGIESGDELHRSIKMEIPDKSPQGSVPTKGIFWIFITIISILGIILLICLIYVLIYF